MESINLTVREGDSFDELFPVQKPVGTPRDFTGSELIAQIRTSFTGTTVADTFAITKLPTTGHLKLALSASQTEALARDVSLGYEGDHSSTALFSKLQIPSMLTIRFCGT